MKVFVDVSNKKVIQEARFKKYLTENLEDLDLRALLNDFIVESEYSPVYLLSISEVDKEKLIDEFIQRVKEDWCDTDIFYTEVE